MVASLGAIMMDLDRATADVAQGRRSHVFGGDSKVETLAKQLYDNAISYVRQSSGTQTVPASQISALQTYADNRANFMSGLNGGGTYANDVTINTLGQAAGLPIQFISSSAATAPGTPSTNTWNEIARAAGGAASSLAKGVATATKAVAQGVAQQVSTDVKAVGAEAQNVGKTVSTVAKDVSKGNLKGAVQAVSAGAKAAANIAAAGVKDDLAHLKATATSAARDLLNGVAGAEKALIALVSQFSPADLVKMVEGDFKNFQSQFDKLISGTKSADAKAPVKPDPNAIDLSQVTIPNGGAVGNLFKPAQRGQTIYWKNERNDAASIIWYLAALAIVDSLHLRNKILSVFGIKSLDVGADAPTYGFLPVIGAAVVQAAPVILVIVAILVIATVIVATLAGPKTIAGKVAKALSGPEKALLNAVDPGLGNSVFGSGTAGLVIANPTSGATVASPIITGTASPGTVVAVSIDGVAVGQTTATPSGTWSITPTTPVAAGQHSVVAGTSAGQTPPVTFMVAPGQAGQASRGGLKKTTGGHSSSGVTFAVIGVGVALLALFLLSSKNEATQEV